jgi:pimeloyl-ACP methyl ester carboxylesterase
LELIQFGLSPISAETLPPGRFVDLPGRGTTFVVDIAGPQGAPTVLLFHGLSVTGYLNWFPAFGPLSRHFRVLSMDLRGHGRGIPLQGRFRLADCADDAAALLDELEIDRAVAVGYSLGGPVAQLLWRRHPHKVAGLVLCATSRNFGGTRPERWFYSTLLAGSYGLQAARYLPGPLRRSAAPALPSAPEFTEGGRLSQWAMGELRMVSPDTLMQAMNAMGRFSSHVWVSEIDVPTAVIVTTLDRLVAPDRQIKLARAIDGATIHPAHAGHAACVVGASRFVPALVDGCQSVKERLVA